MDIGSILLILALLIPVILFIARPFYEPRMVKQNEAFGAVDHDLSSLLAERDRILNALQELEFDHVLGKIPVEDFPTQRALLIERGAQVLRQLDQLRPVDGEQGDAIDRVEEVIARRRADAARTTGAASTSIAKPQSVVAVDDDLETILAQRRRQRHEKSAGFCPQCGGSVQKSDRFCPKCGSTLSA